jgi:hypothetical protein
MRIGGFAHSLNEERRAGVDVWLEAQNSRHAVYVVDDLASLSMQFFVRVAKVVWVFGESFVMPDGVETGLCQWARRRVDLTYRLGISTRDLIRANTDEWAMFKMKCSLHDVHITFSDMVNDPESGDRRPKRTRNMFQRVQQPCICDP